MIAAMLRVGLTGNIACGKSYVASRFAVRGARTIDADQVAHALLAPGQETGLRVVRAFGPGILAPDGGIDRAALGKVVFGNEERRLNLNSIVHPAVRAELLRRMDDLDRSGGRGIVVVDAALMIESGSFSIYHRIVVVHCDGAIQLCRLAERNGLDEDQARARIASQMPAAEKLKFAHYAIDTSGSTDDTDRQAMAVYDRLLEDESRMV
jgi:dephospho-CoA kinase